MLLRPQTLGLMFARTATPKNELGAKAVQIYAPGGMFWSKKAMIIRNAPYTIENPHLGQIEARLTFADIASRHKGERGFVDGLPVIAAAIKREMTGYRAADSMPKEAYPSRKRSFHTASELRRMLEEKTRGGRFRYEEL